MTAFTNGKKQTTQPAAQGPRISTKTARTFFGSARNAPLFCREARACYTFRFNQLQLASEAPPNTVVQ